MSRKRLLEHLAGALRANSASRCGSRRRRRSTAGRRMTWSSRPTGRTRRPGPGSPSVPARPGAAALQVHLARHRPGLRRLHVPCPPDAAGVDAGARLPVRRHTAAPSSSRCTTRSGDGPVSPSSPHRACRPGGSDEPSDRADPELFADVLDGHEVIANNSRWMNFTTVRCETWRHGNVVLLGDAAHTAHFSIGSGTKLAMEDALALAACLHEKPDVRGRAGCLRGRAPAVVALDPTGRPGQPGVVREHRPVRRPGADAVRVQHHDPQPPGHLRQPAAARPGVRRPADAWFADVATSPVSATAGARRCSSRSGSASLELANRVIVSPMDMYSARRGARRLPPRAPGQQGARRRRPGDDRDGLRVAVGPDHARLHRALDRRAARRLARGSSTSCTERTPRRSASSSATRAQGLDQADVGGHRRAAGRGQLAGRAARPPCPTPEITRRRTR